MYPCWIWTIIINLKPWKALTPLTSKQTNLEASSFSFKPPYVIKKFMMIKKTKCWFQIYWTLVGHITTRVSNTNLHNKTIRIAQLVLSMDVTSLQGRDTNLALLMMNFIVFLSSWFICSFHLLTNPLKLMFLGTYQSLKT